MRFPFACRNTDSIHVMNPSTRPARGSRGCPGYSANRHNQREDSRGDNKERDTCLRQYTRHTCVFTSTIYAVFSSGTDLATLLRVDHDPRYFPEPEGFKPSCWHDGSIDSDASATALAHASAADSHLLR